MTRFRVIYWVDQRGICDAGDYDSAEHAGRVAFAVWHRKDVTRVEVVRVEMTLEPWAEASARRHA